MDAKVNTKNFCQGLKTISSESQKFDDVREQRLNDLADCGYKSNISDYLCYDLIIFYVSNTYRNKYNRWSSIRESYKFCGHAPTLIYDDNVV